MVNLNELRPGFYNITDPCFELQETAFKLNETDYSKSNPLYTACSFERCVYKSVWNGGGSLTVRVMNKIN